jgi:bifunctional DNA-binding transcriptional regulator/antitoxin component of YhaV-PrlF toxin-antitoxin module
MAMTRMSSKGQVVIPKPIRDQAGGQVGREYIVATDGEVITLTPRQAKTTLSPRLSTQELLARRVRWNGTPITDDMISGASAEAAAQRFARSAK